MLTLVKFSTIAPGCQVTTQEVCGALKVCAHVIQGKHVSLQSDASFSEIWFNSCFGLNGMPFISETTMGSACSG